MNDLRWAGLAYLACVAASWAVVAFWPDVMTLVSSDSLLLISWY